MSRPKMMQCLAHPPPTSPRILRKIATPFPTPLGCTDALENKTKHPGCLSPGVIRRVHVTATPPRHRRRDITLSKQSPLVAMVSPMTSRREYSAASSAVVSQNGSGNHLDYEEYMKSRQDRTNKDRFQHLQPFSEMPGPRGLPMIGTLWDYMKKDGYTFGKMFEVMTQRAAEYGPVYREQIADRLHVVVSDLDEYHKVIAVDGRFPHRIELEPFAHFRRQRGMSLGTVNSQGDEWYRHRKVVSKKTLRPKEVLAYCEPMNGVADDLIVNLTDKLGKNGEVKDIERELFKWALESVGTVIFEERIGSFDQPPSKMSVQFLDNLIGFFNNMQPLMFNAPIYKYWATPTWKTFEGHADKVVEAGMHFINKKVQTLQSSAQRDTGDNVHLLTYLLSQSSLTPSEALSHALDLMTGGVETTSNGVLWTLYLLSKHPETQKALRKELEEVLPNNEAIDETSLPNLPYIKACLKETFRIYPITFATSRIINQDIELGGFHIPTGTHVQANLYGMGHNPKFFPNPEQYEPERWLRDNNDMDPALQAFSHLPWGHGPRMCIGRRLAEQEIYIATSKIIRAFDVEYVGPPIEPVLKTVMTPDKPMQFKLTPRKKQNSYEWKQGLSQSEGTGLTM